MQDNVTTDKSASPDTTVKTKKLTTRPT